MAPTKIITSINGGMCVTDNKELYEYMMAFKDQGRLRVYGMREQNDSYPYEGYNLKFNDVFAAVGLSQFNKLETRIFHKHRLSMMYHESLQSEVDSRYLPWHIDYYPDPHVIEPVILQMKLKALGRGSALFAKPMSFHVKGWNTPNAEYFSESGLYLPSSSDLTDEDVKRVCDAIKKACHSPT
jgi:perosamine synthetase